MSDKILSGVADYYSAKLAEHGETAQGVDWNGAQSQALRFEQLATIIGNAQDFSISDVGCGYGALYDYLSPRYPRFHYIGCDISHDMVSAARRRHDQHQNAEFHAASKPPAAADFAVASGIFNVRLEEKEAPWHAYMLSMIDVLNESSSKGFAFNCLTKYSDEDRKRPYLYYADPCALFDHCKRSYSRNVALLHDYDLYEFTILVRKSK
jgi:SAM-dependent methyltransferase